MDGYLFLNAKKCSYENIILHGFSAKTWDHANIYLLTCLAISL